MNKKSLVTVCVTLILAATITVSLLSIKALDKGPTVTVDKTATVYEIKCAQEILVTLTVNGTGLWGPLDVMLVIDRSGSMLGEPLTAAKAAAKYFIDNLTFTGDPVTSDWIGIVSYSTTASLDQGLTDNSTLAKSAVCTLSAAGYTNIMAGVHIAQEELTTHGRANTINVIVILSDGVANRWTNFSTGITYETATWPSTHTTSTLKAINEATTAKNAGTIIFTIGLNLASLGVSQGVATDTLKQMATSLDYFFDAATPGYLEEIYGIIAIYTGPAATDLTLTDVVEDEFIIVGGSINPPPTSLVGNTIIWKFATLGNETKTFQYKIRPIKGLEEGNYLTNVEANLTYTDPEGNPATLIFPNPTVYLHTVPVRLIESCDSTGVRKDTFNIGDIVYVNGSGYDPSTTYDIYIVNDVITWTDGMTIPAPVPGTTTTVASDPSGNIPPTPVWSAPLTLGKYDIVVDVNGNGKYDLCMDALDDNDIQVTAGFFVIPEYWLGTILGLVGCFAALAVFRASKHRADKTPAHTRATRS